MKRSMLLFVAVSAMASTGAFAQDAAALAKSKQCGWKGSTNKTKKLPNPPVGTDQKKDIEVDVIPTPQEIDTLAKTLGGKK